VSGALGALLSFRGFFRLALVQLPRRGFCSGEGDDDDDDVV
jgi:hypothetical protein